MKSDVYYSGLFNEIIGSAATPGFPQNPRFAAAAAVLLLAILKMAGACHGFPL